MNIDIVVDTSRGDSAKGKVAYSLLKKTKYDLAVRANGGSNAGHTIYHNGIRFATHIIPAGVFFGVQSLIGSGCVLNVKSFFEEIDYLEKLGISARKYIKIAKNTHIVTQNHLDEEADESKVGTTRRGIAPCYRDRYNRVGTMAENISALQEYIVDTYDFIYDGADKNILIEGAQGFYLSIDSKDYPYVTSSHCNSAGMLLDNLSPRDVRNVYGTDKAYRTYVGTAPFQPEGEIFDQIAKMGKEIGVTTGRTRKINYLDLNEMKRAVRVNGCTHLIINKMDILKDLNHWKMLINNSVISLTEESFKQMIIDSFPNVDVQFSYSPHEI
jgi:adenylosuccinate synthase